MKRRLKLEGERIGLWTVLSFQKIPNATTGNWLCRCDCGTERIITTGNLRSGATYSCGCRRKNQTHGMTNTPEYKIWNGMKQRCRRGLGRRSRYYGDRGIEVCERWANSFENFYKDMGPRPGPDYSLDRIDNERDYEPGNCRWATRSEQYQNRRGRSGRQLTLDEVTRTIAEWAEEIGITPQALYQRLRSDLSIREALTNPKRSD